MANTSTQFKGAPMARIKETILKRIARGTDHTEDSLLEFLKSGDQSHLPWHGALKPPVRKMVVVIAQASGLQRRVTKSPQPVLRGDINPIRALYCIHHKLDELDPLIELRCNCGMTTCISPFHRRLHKRFDRMRASWPENPTAADPDLDALIKEIEAYPEVYKEAPLLLRDHPVSRIRAAFEAVGWPPPPEA